MYVATFSYSFHQYITAARLTSGKIGVQYTRKSVMSSVHSTARSLTLVQRMRELIETTSRCYARCVLDTKHKLPQRNGSVLQRHIVSVALQEGRRLLYSGHAALAIPAALQAVRYLTELQAAEDGASGDIAPAYLILSEAAIRELACAICTTLGMYTLCRAWASV